MHSEVVSDGNMCMKLEGDTDLRPPCNINIALFL